MVMNLEKIRDKIEDLFDVPSELYTACWLDQCILNYWFCDYATPLWLHKIYHYHLLSMEQKLNNILSSIV